MILFFVNGYFRKFRRNSPKTYDFDPAHLYSAPGLSWVPATKITKVELKLLTDLKKTKNLHRLLVLITTICLHLL